MTAAVDVPGVALPDDLRAQLKLRRSGDITAKMAADHALMAALGAEVADLMHEMRTALRGEIDGELAVLRGEIEHLRAELQAAHEG